MSSISTYDVSVPILVRNLEILTTILKKGEAWAKENGKDAEAFLQTRLVDDMLVSQIAFLEKSFLSITFLLQHL